MLDIFEGLELDIDEMDKFDDEIEDEDILVEEYDDSVYDKFVEFDEALQERIPSDYICSTIKVGTTVTYRNSTYPELNISPDGNAEINFGDGYDDMSAFWEMEDWNELKDILSSALRFVTDCEAITEEWYRVAQDYPELFGGE